MLRGLNFAIVDEVDSILIDEARTPLIISGQAEDNLDIYMAMDKLAPNLKRQADENSPRLLRRRKEPPDIVRIRP